MLTIPGNTPADLSLAATTDTGPLAAPGPAPTTLPSPAAKPKPDTTRAAELAEFRRKLEALDAPLVGHGLPADTLKGLLQSNQIVIVHFLRQLGCIYCQNAVDNLHRLVSANPGFPPIYFVHQSPLDYADGFFAQRFPGAAHISDPQRKLYEAFGIRYLTPSRLFNPLGVLKGFYLTFKGYFNKTGPTGNVWVLSGTYVFNRGQLAWMHRAQFAGDEPRWERLRF